MASDVAAIRRYTAVQTTDSGEITLGTLAIDGQGHIRVEHGAADATLEEVAERMNGKKMMHVDAPSPEDAPRFTLTSRIVRRGDPEFVPALQDYLRKYYKLDLIPQ